MPFAFLIACFRKDEIIKDREIQMQYFKTAEILGIGFSFVCFFVTVWRKSSSVSDLVNYFKFKLSQDAIEDGEKHVR